MLAVPISTGLLELLQAVKTLLFLNKMKALFIFYKTIAAYTGNIKDNSLDNVNFSS